MMSLPIDSKRRKKGLVNDERKEKISQPAKGSVQKPHDPYIRAENEDDDGYDPYSDRRPEREPLFEPDPWR